MPMTDRQKFTDRTITISGELQRETAINALRHLPIYATDSLEVVFREQKKVRGLSANAKMWVGPLADIAEQGYVDGKKFSAEVWAHFFKVHNLPDPDAEDFDPTHVKDGYIKWDYTPDGERVLVGSTTQLTVKGFSVYLEKMHADGANIGVQFSASPNEQRMMI